MSCTSADMCRQVRTAGAALARLYLCTLVLMFTSCLAHASPDDRDAAILTLRLLDGDTDAAIAALPVGFDARQEVFAGLTLLAVAAISDDAAQIQKLAAAGFDPKLDTSALEVAAQYGAAKTFAALLDMVQPNSNALDDLAYRSVNGYFVLVGARKLLRLAAEQVRDGQSPDPKSGPCFWELINVLTGPRVSSETDGHLEILALLKARGASLDVVPGIGKTFAAFTLESGEIYLQRQILHLNGQLNTFTADTAIASALQNENADSLAYLRRLAPDRFEPSLRIQLLDTHFDKLTTETFLVLSEPELVLPPELARKLLMRFASDRRSNALARLLTLGASIQPDPVVFLRIASLYGSIESVRLLLAAGAAPNVGSMDGRFVLDGLAKAVIEARNGNLLDKCSADRRRDRLLEVTRLLLDRGAPLLANDAGALVFHEFLERRYLDGDFIDLLTPTGPSRTEALVASAAAGSLEFVRWFVETRGVSVAATDATGRSVFQAALAGSGAHTLAPYLLDRMDSVEGLFDGSSFIQSLEFFFALKCDKCVDKLLSTAADLDRIPDSGSLFINTVLRAGNLQLASKLLNLGASPLLKDKRGESAVDFLCRQEPSGLKDIASFRKSFAQLLLENNVDLRSVNYGGRSILFDCFANTSRDEAVLDILLLLNGGVIEPPLVEYALQRFGRVELAWLKRNSVNLAGKTSSGTPFLSVTIQSNNAAAFNVILEQSTVDVSAKDADGESALQLAFRMRRGKMARLLLAAGAGLPQDANALSSFGSNDNDLADVVLLDLLSKQVLAEVPQKDNDLAKLLERMESANSASISVGSWSFEANPPWIGLVPYTPPAQLAVTAEVPLANTGIGVSLFTSITSHRYAGIAQSKNTEPRGLCMAPNDCYKGYCGYCSNYEYQVSTRFTLPPCVQEPSQVCLSTASIENDASSGAVITVTQAGKPPVSVSPGASVLRERTEGAIDVQVSVTGTTFYAGFFARLDSLPAWPAQPAVYSSERLRLYLRALHYQDLIAGAQDQDFYSTDSTIVAHRYWSAKMARGRYAELAAEKLRHDLAAVESVPAIFDSLFESLADVEQLSEVQLPVLVQQVRDLSQVMEGPLRDRLNVLATELVSAAGKATQAAARLLEVRDELLAHHRTLSDSLRLNLLEYLQFGDRAANSPLKQMSKARKEAVLARLSRKPGEVTSQLWRDRDKALTDRIRKAN